MRLVVGIALCLAMAGACASDRAADWLVIPVYALHLDRGAYCNDLAAGLGFERAHTESAYSLGAYRNSNCRLSFWASGCWLPLQFWSVKGGACVGAVTGYEKPLIPIGAFVATYERKTWGLNLIVVPPVGGSSPGVAWLQWKKPW